MMAFTASLMIGTAGLPHVIIRFFTVPSVAALGDPRVGARIHCHSLHNRTGHCSDGAA